MSHQRLSLRTDQRIMANPRDGERGRLTVGTVERRHSYQRVSAMTPAKVRNP